MAKRAQPKPARRMTRTSMKRTKGGGTGTGALLNASGDNTWQNGHNTGALRNVSNNNA